MKTKQSNLYITLSKSFLAKTQAAANKRAFEAFSSEPDKKNEDTLFYSTSDIALNDETEVNFDPEENELQITIRSDLGYFNWAIPLDLDLKIGIVENVVKQFNKVKGMLESAK